MTNKKLVERLRGGALFLDLANEAADEIERLREEDIATRERALGLLAVLEKIADLHRGPGSALARSALDTMRALEKHEDNNNW